MRDRDESTPGLRDPRPLPRRVVARTLVLGVSVLPFRARSAAAQSGRVPRVGYLSLGTPASPFQEAFVSAFRALGYIDGRTVRLEYRHAHGRGERLGPLAAELVNAGVDVIVAQSTQAVDAARRATRVIPIVFPVTFDPVASGFVESLARPGGNSTGLTPLNPVVTAKRVELIHELMPSLTRVAVLRNPTNSGSVLALRETEHAAERVGIRLLAIEARSPDELERAIKAAVAGHAGALMVLSDSLFFRESRRIVEIVNRLRLPQVFDTKDFVEAGGLMSYGADLDALYRRSAVYVDKILKGARPATLPVEQATKFELVVNAATARSLGLTIPQSIALRADRILE